ncbi:hypothetical protein [Humisphaera borealis]|uniref:Uncharacterized protein n=1 Tax=Humisphaera borealis TaxID=2807512 RepID=A0A7M2WWV9_9BACT|nr:hypothetical protein [Humisphaera borealis]QOV90018.1 hypothetical protein IPV69_01190 [Humisphaera borealis]
MFFTARQLEQLHRESGSAGRITLPYRARLTPMAQDWIRLKKVSLGYCDDASKSATGTVTTSAPSSARPQGGVPGTAGQASIAQYATEQPTTPLLWWCDGPCGAAKAALTGQAKESLLRPIDLPQDPKQIVAVVKTIAGELKSGSASSAAIVVQNAAVAMVFANRCPSIRAVVGTCLEAVEQGIQQVAANVLVIEHPHKAFPQIKTMLGRFARAKRELSPDVQRQLAELATCG